ncbi:uncharacterized protein PAC_14628 [Phialocephala subalpina]|uniref:NACHT domain-containing protein n=1 Tax=Phialocephala subalpina TaxID=576137 RepID=A0A1L7XI54_9HELO|nr:uncharacterized protein PAC_14628 [Phialocephala subalpina]
MTTSIMACRTNIEDQSSVQLQEQAIEKAREALSRLPKGNVIFEQCIRDQRSVIDIVASVVQHVDIFHRKRSARILRKFHDNTRWLENISGVIDVVTQTQAGIGCPLWAPIKFVLLVSNNQIAVVEQASNLVLVMSEHLPRLEIYGRLQSDPVLQTALLNVFTDVVTFSVKVYHYFRRSLPVRLVKAILRPSGDEFGEALGSLKRHSNIADSTAVAIELERASKFREDAKIKDQQNQRLQCRNLLQPVDTERILEEHTRTRLHGTCNWILTNSTFLGWKNNISQSNNDRILCVSGGPGCGKTVLFSSLVEHLKDQETVLFFPFQGNNESRRDIGCLVRSLLWQSLRFADERGLKIVRDLVLAGSLTNSGLWQAFKDVMALSSAPAFCIIDGVDECDDSIQVLLDHILDFLDSGTKFRVAFFGQALRLTPVIGVAAWNIKIDSTLVQHDIDIYIKSRINQSEVLNSSQLEDSIFKNVQEGSGCVFLWAKLILEDLCNSATAGDIIKRLSHLPRGLEQAYQHILSRLINRLDPHQLLLAKSLLSLVVASFRPLTVLEIQHAYACGYNHGPSHEHNLLLQPKNQILNVLDGLVTIVNGHVQLVHFSILGFLTRPREEWPCRDDEDSLHFRLSLEESHRFLGSICVDYLGSSDYNIPMSEIESRYPFWKYATRYAFNHMYRSGQASSPLLSKIGDFVNSKQFGPWLEYLAMLTLEDNSFFLLDSELTRIASWLKTAGFNKKRLEKIIFQRIRQELGERGKNFGEEDPRTEQCQLFLDYLELIGFADETPHVESTSSTRICSSALPSSLPTILSNFDNIAALSLPRQLHLIVRLSSHLKKLKDLPDVLEMLFRLFLGKASLLPVAVVLAISSFYEAVGKPDNALSLYAIALKRVEAKEIPPKYTIIALEHYLHVQVGLEKLLGLEHLDTLQTLSEIGYCYFQLANYQLALESFQQALIGRKKILGLEHLDTLVTLNDIGCCYFRSASYQIALEFQQQALLALEFYQQALAGREKLLGLEHPKTLQTLMTFEDELDAFDDDKRDEAFVDEELDEIPDEELSKGAADGNAPAR